MNTHMLQDPALVKKKAEIYWNMLQTAEQVAKRYGITRDAMDEYGAASQQKACAAQAAGKFNDEIAPITVMAGMADPVMGRYLYRPVLLTSWPATIEVTSRPALASPNRPARSRVPPVTMTLEVPTPGGPARPREAWPVVAMGAWPVLLWSAMVLTAHWIQKVAPIA
jgi:hypothetical protein